jgi:pilus assembly protein Flp/PilA
MAHGASSTANLSFEGADAVLALQQWGFDMRNFLSSFIRDESGAAAAEYALILAIVGAGIAVAAKNLGTAISSAINTAQGNI